MLASLVGILTFSSSVISIVFFELFLNHSNITVIIDNFCYVLRNLFSFPVIQGDSLPVFIG